MSNLIPSSRDQHLFLPYDLREWVSNDDFVHFVIEAVESIDLDIFTFNRRGTGSAQYHPHVMLTLLIYSYAMGVFSSRRIERASYRDLSIRYILSNTHPDHTTIAKFRRENSEAISSSFLHVLKLATELGFLKVGTISVDGTKIKANANKSRNLRYDRAQELETQLESDIASLMKEAERADSVDDLKDESLPKEIQRREALREKVIEAKTKIEERERKRYEQEKVAFDKKMKDREDQNPPPRGRKPQAPSSEVNPKLCHNLTDGDSRVMRHNKTSELVQGYNAQAAVDVDGSMLILGTYITSECNDKKQLSAITTSVNPKIGTVNKVLADAGFGSEKEIGKVEALGIETLISVHQGALEEGRHYDFRPSKNEDETTKKKEKKSEKEWVKKMRKKMALLDNKECYKKRQQTVEPVFGIIKEVLGFRQFLTRGLENVTNEWNLVSTAYNFKRLFSMISTS